MSPNQNFKEGSISWAEIDLDAIAFNINSIKKHTGESVKLIAVVKANAYGHGAIQVTKTAINSGATCLAVHRIIEGSELRRANIDAPVLVMGYASPNCADIFIRERLTPTLTTLELAQALSSKAQACQVTVPVHIKVDTGMNRFGLAPGDVLEFLRFARALPGIEIEGIYTHFATADAADQTNLRRQLHIFKDVLLSVQNAGIHIPVIHACNSAALMVLPEAHFTAVRPGIALYGLNPSDEWDSVFEIHPVLSLKSRVSNLRYIQKGTGVSYGFSFITQRDTIAALVSIGYGDGYHRALSNCGSVLIHGKRAPIIGRVCMDQLIVDVTDIEHVKRDDDVVLIGKQGDNRISAEEIATLADTINYEITTSLSKRVDRIYLHDGKPVRMINLLGDFTECLGNKSISQ